MGLIGFKGVNRIQEGSENSRWFRGFKGAQRIGGGGEVPEDSTG